MPRDLAAVHATWRGRRCGGNETPFGDDLDPAASGKEAGQILLLDVFDKRERFRLSHLAGDLLVARETALSGRFIVEVDLDEAHAFLRAQANATVEALVPTCYPDKSCARLLRISLLLGAVRVH